MTLIIGHLLVGYGSFSNIRKTTLLQHQENYVTTTSWKRRISHVIMWRYSYWSSIGWIWTFFQRQKNYFVTTSWKRCHYNIMEKMSFQRNLCDVSYWSSLSWIWKFFQRKKIKVVTTLTSGKIHHFRVRVNTSLQCHNWLTNKILMRVFSCLYYWWHKRKIDQDDDDPYVLPPSPRRSVAHLRILAISLDTYASVPLCTFRTLSALEE